MILVLNLNGNHGKNILNSIMRWIAWPPLCQNSCHPQPNNPIGGKGDNHGTIQPRTQTSNTKQTTITESNWVWYYLQQLYQLK